MESDVLSSSVEVILLRGLGREAAHWGSWLDDLKNSKMIQKVTPLDQPGTGTEFRRKSFSSVEKNLEDLRKRLPEKETDLRIALSISLGSMVALKWIEKYPQDFDAVVTMNTSESGTSTPMDRLKIQGMKEFLQIFVSGDAKKFEQKVFDLTSSIPTPAERRDSIIESWVQVHNDRPVTKRTLLLQLMAAGKFRLKSRFTKPVLLLASKGDKFVRSECSQSIADAFGGECSFHPDAGHDLPLDAPDWCTQQVESFISKIVEGR